MMRAPPTQSNRRTIPGISTMARLLCLLGLLCLVSRAFGFARQPSNARVNLVQLTETAASSSSQLELFSPCKINLFLRILYKRPDNFHELASLFQCIGFGDTLTLEIKTQERAESDDFTCNMEGVPTDSSNLVIRALELLRTKTQNDVYFKVDLNKQCPAQAGLGGGSANAATALWGANQLLGQPASLDQLVEWSADLGSDITFFLSKGTAYCTGRGEILQVIDPPLDSGTPVVIVKPDVGLSTPSVFQALDYDKLSHKDPKELLNTFLKGIETVDNDCFINDLEPPAFSVVPQLQELKERLIDFGFEHVMMSGSGTSIFCLGKPDNASAFDAFCSSRDDLQVFKSEFIGRPDGEWFQRPQPDR